MPESPQKDLKWQHPKDILKLQKLKLKKKALQERISGEPLNKSLQSQPTEKAAAFESIFSGKKRKNPFVKQLSEPKRTKKSDIVCDESTDQTLFKLLSCSTLNESCSYTSFSEILSKINNEKEEKVEVKAVGKEWCPIDWTLKRKIRLISLKPFPWNQKLKISEEASGITSFSRCLDIENSATTLDASPNAKFHQCCLIWQQPFLPWLPLFPRSTSKGNLSGINLAASSVVKNSLYQSWTDSLRSLFQLLRTKQCPYFYVCANSFTILFRAAGILSYTDLHAIVTPTTRGFRHMLRQEEIEFTMPLKKKRISDLELETNDTESVLGEELINEEIKQTENGVDEEETPDEEWLKHMGVNAEDIKQINYTQARIEHKAECDVDSSEQSLILIEGVEVNSFFNFLINCKSAIAPTGPLAGIPPTLLAPVCFQGATLNSLKVRENKIHSDGTDFYCLELTGPVLPSTVHNLFNINSSDHSMTATFSDLENTQPFSKIVRRDQRKSDIERCGTSVFSKENLSDCGLNPKILKHFCSADPAVVSNVECLKYSGDSQTFTWT